MSFDFHFLKGLLMEESFGVPKTEYQDTAWTDLAKSISDAERFITAFFSPKAENLVKYLDDQFEDEPLRTISVLNKTSYDVDNIFLKVVNNGNLLRNGPGEKLQVTSLDTNIFQNIDKCLLPIYLVEEAATPLISHICKDCECKFTYTLQGVPCVYCGVQLCSLCTNFKRVMQLGSNENQALCSTCVEKCTEENALKWINQAKFALGCGDNEVARILLGIGNKYVLNLGSKQMNSPRILKARKQVEKVASDLKDFKTKILCLQHQGIKEFQWGTQAIKMCEEGDHLYPYALFCLKMINAKSTPDSHKRWETLGDRLGDFHEELAFFCYNQSNFLPDKWIQMAKLYDNLASEGNKKRHFQMAYHCIENGINKLPKTQQIAMVDKLFQENGLRLALYTLRAASFTRSVIVDLLRSWYNKVTKHYDVVVAIIKYIIVRVLPEVIIKFPKTDPALHAVSQLLQLSAMPGDRIIRERVNRMNEIEDLIFPLAFIKYKLRSSWDDLEKKASNEMNCEHAARIFWKLDDIGRKLSGRRREDENPSRLDIERDSYIEELKMD